MKIKIEKSQGAAIHVIWAPLVLAVLLGVRLLSDFHVLLPTCPFHQLTGIPCLTCGGVRSVMAVARLDFVAAISANPLVAVSMALIFSLSLLHALSAALGRRLNIQTSGRFRVALRSVLAVLILSNWAYLIASGR